LAASFAAMFPASAGGADRFGSAGALLFDDVLPQIAQRREQLTALALGDL
jgi:hypothetical protein